jgi:hypothetical protein
VARNFKGNKGRIIAYALYLGASKTITLRTNTKPGMVNVDIDGDTLAIMKDCLVRQERNPNPWACTHVMKY